MCENYIVEKICHILFYYVFNIIEFLNDLYPLNVQWRLVKEIECRPRTSLVIAYIHQVEEVLELEKN